MKERVKNILLSEDYFIFNKRFVKVLGLEPTFLLINLIEGADILKTKDGWFFQTFKLLEELTGLNRRRQERAIEVLIEFGIVSKKKMGVPCRRYFKINNERLKEVLRGESGEKEKSGLVKEEDKKIDLMEIEEKETKILEEDIARKLINGRGIDEESLLSKASKDSEGLYDREEKETKILEEDVVDIKLINERVIDKESLLSKSSEDSEGLYDREEKETKILKEDIARKLINERVIDKESMPSKSSEDSERLYDREEKETKILKEDIARKLINGRRINEESLLSKSSEDSERLYDREEKETKILEECVDRKLINGRRIDEESLLIKANKDSVGLYGREDKECRELLKENLLGLEEREELKENNNFQKKEGKIIEEIGFEDNKQVCPKEPYSLNEKYNIVCSEDTDSLDEKSIQDCSNCTDSLDEKSIQDCSNCTDSLYQENNTVCSKSTNRFVPDKQTYKEININKIDKEINIKIDRSINNSQKKNSNNFQKKYSAKASSIDQNFKNNILNFKEIIINSTKTPKEIVNNLVFNMVSILREYDLNTLIEKIKESDFLMGKLEIKPRITNFTRKNMIDRIMADEYKNRDYHKKEERIDYGRIEREIDPRTEELYRMLGLS